MDTNTITPTVAKIYALTDGSLRDSSGENNFHPLSTVNMMEVYLEDGDSSNVATINFNPSIRKSWATHWYPLFYRGLVEHTLDGEENPRTFAQYIGFAPSIFVSMNQNSKTSMAATATFQQQSGANLIGSYNTVDSLPTSYEDWEDLQDLEEAGAIAYVWESGSNGFYKVEYDSEEETYSWVLQDTSIQAEVNTKQYDTWDISVKPGYGNPAPITPLEDEQYRLIWKELNYLSGIVESIVDLELEDYVISRNERIKTMSQNSLWNMENKIEEDYLPNSRVGWCQVNEVLYMFGNLDFKGSSFEPNFNYENGNRVYKYNFRTRTLTRLNDLPNNWFISEMRCVNVGGYIYLLGGYAFTEPHDESGDLEDIYNVLTNHNLKYNISTDTYELLTAAPDVIAKVSGAEYVSTDNSIYVMVDSIVDGSAYREIDTQPYKLNLSTLAWSKLAEADTMFDGGFSKYVSSENKIYVQRSDKFKSYNIATNTWTDLTAPTYGNHHTGLMQLYKNRLFIGSGYNEFGDENSPYVQYYNISEDKWYSFNRLEYDTEPIGHGTLVLYDNKMFYISGYSNDSEALTNKYVFSFPLEITRIEELEQGKTYTDNEINKIKNGTYTADKATKDASGNVITATYETKADATTHKSDTDNPHEVTKAQVGLGNVDNTSDANKPVSTAQQSALDLKIDLSQKGAVNGVCPLNSSGIVDPLYVPNAYDDYTEVATYADLPTTGSENVLYVVIADETSGGNTSTYRWTGSVYVIISDKMSASEVKALYESNADTNAFTDSEKAELPKINDKIKCNVITQSGSEFYRTSQDTTLYEGRRECVDISGITTGTGAITYSIDGNTTKKPVVDTDGNQLDLSNISDRGIYLMGVYDGTNWVITAGSDDYNVLYTKVNDNEAVNEAQNTVIDNIVNVVSAGGQIISQIVEQTVGVTLTGTNQKITFDTLKKASNDITIIDVDTNNDHKLLSTNSAGYLVGGNVTFTSTAGFFTTSVCVLDLYINGVLKDTLTISAGFNESVNKIKDFECVLATQPQTVTVQSRVTNGSGTLTASTLRVSTNWTSTGGVPGPSTTNVTTLSSPATESPSGTQTLQKGANEEFTSILKESGKVLTGTYVSSGQFKLDSNNDLSANNIYTIKFGETSDTNNAKFSVDNGTTYKNVVYENDDLKANVKANEISEKIVKLYYDGTDFIILDDTTVIESESNYTARVESTVSEVAPINGTPEVKAYGGRFEQDLLNGNFEDTSEWVETNTTLSVSGNIGSFTVTAQSGGIYQTIANSASTNYYYLFMAEVKANSSLVGLSHFGADYVYHTGSGEWELLVSLAQWNVAANNRFSIADKRTSGWDEIQVKNAMCIPLGTNPLGYTATQLANKNFPYFEGLKHEEDIKIKFSNENLFKKEDYTTVDYSYKIAVKPSTVYTWNESIAYKTYDISGNEISSGTALTVTTDSNAVYIAFSNAIADTDAFMLVQGSSVPSSYVAHEEQEKTLYGTFRSVGSARDEVYNDGDEFVKKANVAVDTTVVKATTGWTISSILTTTHRFFKDLSSSLNYKVPSSNSAVSNIIVKVGTTTFTTVSANDSFSNDTENTVTIDTSGFLLFRVNKTTYPDSASFETYLQSNNISFYYEVETPTITAIETDGSLAQYPITTISQSQDIPADLDITWTMDKDKQVEVLTQRANTTDKKIDNAEVEIANKVDKDGSKVLSDNNYTDADKTKMNYIEVSQYVDLDDMESDISDNITAINAIGESELAIVMEYTGSLAQTSLQTISAGYTAIQSYDLIRAVLKFENESLENTEDKTFGAVTQLFKPSLLYSISDKAWSEISNPGTYDYEEEGFNDPDLYVDSNTATVGETMKITVTIPSASATRYYEVVEYKINGAVHFLVENADITGASDSATPARSVLTRSGTDLKYALCGAPDTNTKVVLKLYGIML